MGSTTSTRTGFSGLSAIGQIAITVADVDRAVAYYRDALGMHLLFQFPGLGFFDCGGVRLMLTAPEKPGERTIIPSSISRSRRSSRPMRLWRLVALHSNASRT